ncbi:MAG: efflux transporter periplasmic adaptor subunit, partial [Flavobacteriales bacterium]|nr:efflux transporter periplasmic adaptor subunit [Flavobacteriales bacterium]
MECCIRFVNFKYLLIVSYLIFIQLGCGESKEGIRPEIGEMTESVYASVKIEPIGLYKAFAAAPGIIESIHVDEGDSLLIGQAIASIKAERASINRSDAVIQAELARENYNGQAAILSSLKDELESYRKQFSMDSLNYYRQKRLWEQNIGSKNEYEQAELRYDLTRNTLSRLEKNYLQNEKQLESNYLQSMNALEHADVMLSDYTVSSRIDGMVYQVLKVEGEVLGQMEPIAVIGSADSFILKMSIDEVDIARVS